MLHALQFQPILLVFKAFELVTENDGIKIDNRVCHEPRGFIPKLYLFVRVTSETIASHIADGAPQLVIGFTPIEDSPDMIAQISIINIVQQIAHHYEAIIFRQSF